MATRSSLLGGPDTFTPPSSPLETKTIAAATPTTTSISFSPPIQLQYPKLSCCLFRSNSLHLPSRKGLTVLAVVDKEPENAEKINNVKQENGDFESKKQTKPCELYVCNLSGCSDIADLAEMFNSFGSVLSVEHDNFEVWIINCTHIKLVLSVHKGEGENIAETPSEKEYKGDASAVAHPSIPKGVIHYKHL